MYSFILPVHSFLPYVILSLLIISVLVFTVKLLGKKPFTKGDRILALLTLIFSHVQFLVGLILYFISPITKAAFKNSGEIMSNPDYRFYAVEHILVMLLAITLITIGHSRSKKASLATQKFRNLTLFFLLGLILILSRIPWEAWAH
ncbi:MAG: hypothetical protein RLP14_08450 [Owenweeksia sp.]